MWRFCASERMCSTTAFNPAAFIVVANHAVHTRPADGETSRFVRSSVDSLQVGALARTRMRATSSAMWPQREWRAACRCVLDMCSSFVRVYTHLSSGRHACLAATQ